MRTLIAFGMAALQLIIAGSYYLSNQVFPWIGTNDFFVWSCNVLGSYYSSPYF